VLILKDTHVSRRNFLQGAMAGVAAAGLPAWYAEEANAHELERARALPKRIMPGDTVLVGVIGPGGSKGGFRQGLGDTRAIRNQPGVRVVAVCDVDTQHREEAAKAFPDPDIKQFKDFREMLQMKDLDAVVIGTPDHWHAIIAIAAMKAGKDVYCEKPLTLNIDEAKKIVKTQAQTNAIFQTGSQQRSDARFRLACELVRNGRIGKIHTVKTNLPAGVQGGPFTETAPPDGFDWDMWQGPAHEHRYVKERTHGSFRHWLEYSGGMMTDWGAHHNDIMQWGLGMDGSGPIAVEGKGTPASPSGEQCYNAFPQFEVKYTYPGGITVICSSSGENGVEFIGSEGSIFVSRGTIRASDPELLAAPLPSGATRLYASNNHAGNFVDGVRMRRSCICNAEVGARSVTVCHLGNISMRLGNKPLQWDPKKEMFTGPNAKEANKLLSYNYRGRWRI
jgi:predicted dehydrogenase